jgi:hypothetical protein
MIYFSLIVMASGINITVDRDLQQPRRKGDIATLRAGGKFIEEDEKAMHRVSEPN